MAKAMEKNPRSLRLGAAEIEAAALLGKAVDHLVARETRPGGAKAVDATVVRAKLPRRQRTVVQTTDAEIEPRARGLFGAEQPEVELIEIAGHPHVAGGSQDAADATPPASLGLTEEQCEALSDAFPTVSFQEVDVSLPVRSGILGFLRAAPPEATAADLLMLAEALS